MIDIPALVGGHIFTFEKEDLVKWFTEYNKKSHPMNGTAGDMLDNYTLLDEDIYNNLHRGVVEDKKERLRKRVPLLRKLDDDQIEKVMNRLSSIFTAISQEVDLPNYSDLLKKRIIVEEETRKTLENEARESEEKSWYKLVKSLEGCLKGGNDMTLTE